VPKKKLPVDSNCTKNLVYLDIETTGLSAEKGAKILEIAMLKVSDNLEETRYEKLVNPQRPIAAECSQIHFIYDEMVKDAPAFKDIAAEVLDFIGSNTVVCHNAKFDLSFVKKEIYEALNLKVDFNYIDTLMMARRHFNFSSNALGAIADTVGIEVGVRHRAMADVLTMQAVSKYLFKRLMQKGIDEITIGIF
jgi:DNA polymerase-3 subunit epsilon